MKVDVIALKGFGTYKKGARARMPKYHAATLESPGFVKVVPAEVVPPAPVVPKRGTYARRDMTAETRGGAPAAKAIITAQSDRPISYAYPREDDGKAE